MAPKLSLYASLLGPESKEDAEPTQDDSASSKKQALNAAALRFQPMRRPGVQAANQKSKTKPAFAKQLSSDNTLPGTANGSDKSNVAPVAQTSKMTLADWTAEDGDDFGYAETREPRQRGGRRKKKKKKEDEPVVQDWDDLYDPTRPNNYEEYMHSEERIREIREWKERLYAHRMAEKRQDDLMSDSEDDRPRRAMNAQFAPPLSYNFAPPPSDETSRQAVKTHPVDIDMEETADDAYARRMRLSQVQQPPPPPPPAQGRLPSPPPPPPPPPPPEAGTISRAPVRYNLPAASPDIPATEAELERKLEEDQAMPDVQDTPSTDEPGARSSRPGQKGFAERLMSKYGWTKGSGLGAAGTGITSALKVKVDKGKNSGHGKIIGGKRKIAEEEGKFGAMSEVVALRGMIDGLNLQVELGPDGNLMQEIGEECGEKYGQVQRVYIPRDSEESSVPVFIHFTNQLSALRAVNALEGRVFNGNTITAKFFDEDKFRQGVYE